MPCTKFTMDGGKVVGIVCTGRSRAKSCSVCGQRSARECDFPLTGSKAGKTCDRPLCVKCSKSRPDGKGDTIDYCPAHAKMVAEQGELFKEPNV